MADAPATKKRARWIAPQFVQEAISVGDVTGGEELSKRNFRSVPEVDESNQNAVSNQLYQQELL
jgi:hypothetical protein